MHEKQLKAGSGMLALIVIIATILVSIGLIVWGVTVGALPCVLGILGVIVGAISFAGLKILNPKEALVLTLFGNYIGTLREPGFYFVHPFCTAVNPSAKTKIGQSADVDDGHQKKLIIAKSEESVQLEAALK